MPRVENIRAIYAAVRQEGQETVGIERGLKRLSEDMAAQAAVGQPFTNAQLAARRDALNIGALDAARAAFDAAWAATEILPDQDNISI